MERTISQTEQQLHSSNSPSSPSFDSTDQLKTESPILEEKVEDTQNVEKPIITKQEVSLFGPHPILGLGVIGLLWGCIVQFILKFLHFPIFQHQLFCVAIIAIPSLIIWFIILQMDNMLYKSLINIKVNNVDQSSKYQFI